MENNQTIPQTPHINFLYPPVYHQQGIIQDNTTKTQADQMIPMIQQQNLCHFPGVPIPPQHSIPQSYTQKQSSNTHFQNQTNNSIKHQYQQYQANNQGQIKQNKGYNAFNMSNNSNHNNSNSGNNSNTNGNHTTTMRAGDWVCLICSNLNFSFRNECNRCHMQTKQQNFLQNLMMFQQDKTSPQVNSHQNQFIQQNTPFSQPINNEKQIQFYQHQQQQHLLYSLQQQQYQQFYHNTQPLSLNPHQSQQCAGLLKQNSLKRGQSEKENKDPSISQNNSSFVDIISSNSSEFSGSCSQIVRNNLNKQNINNQNSDNDNNLNTPFQLPNQAQQKEINNNTLNTSQSFYNQQNNNNQKDLNQTHQQLNQQFNNCPQQTKQIQQNQYFKQSIQLNQLSFQQQQLELQQSDFNYQTYLQFTNPSIQTSFLPLPNVMQSQQQLFSNQNEFYQQKAWQQYQQQTNQFQQQNGIPSIPVNFYSPQSPNAQITNQLNSNLHNQVYYSQQQYQNEYLQSQQTESEKQDQNTQSAQKNFSNEFYHQLQDLNKIHPLDANNNTFENNKSSKSESDYFFENQLITKDSKLDNQKIFSQFDQQINCFPHSINLIQNQNQISKQYNQQLQKQNSLKISNQTLNKKTSLPPMSKQQSDNTNTITTSQNISSNSYELFKSHESNNSENQSNKNCNQQQDSLCFWSGPQKGFENRLLVTPPKTKQLIMNQPLHDIENMINQFKFMFSSEKKSHSKVKYSNNNSELFLNQLNSTQKDSSMTPVIMQIKTQDKNDQNSQLSNSKNNLDSSQENEVFDQHQTKNSKSNQKVSNVDDTTQQQNKSQQKQKQLNNNNQLIIDNTKISQQVQLSLDKERKEEKTTEEIKNNDCKENMNKEDITVKDNNQIQKDINQTDNIQAPQNEQEKEEI